MTEFSTWMTGRPWYSDEPPPAFEISYTVSRDRSWRRGRKRKAKRRALRVLNMYRDPGENLGSPFGTSVAGEISQALVGKCANHGIKICSCSLCCNPRRHGEVTMQELKAPSVDEWIGA